MTTFNTLVGAVQSIVGRPAAAPAAAAATDDVPAVRMAADARVKLPGGQADLGAARQVIAERAQQVARQREQLADRAASGNLSQGELMAVSAELAGLARAHRDLRALGQLAGRLANKPGATDQDAARFAQLARAAAQGTAPAPLLARAEDVVRNAGRPVPSDRGLAQAIHQLVDARTTIDNQVKHLAAEAATGNKSQGELVRIQAEMATLAEAGQLLDGLKGQASRLADRRDAAPADVARVRDLLAAASQGNRPAGELRMLAAEAEATVRGTDPALKNAISGVVQAIDGTEQRRMALAHDAATGNKTQGELLKLQADLQAETERKAQLGGLQALAGKLQDRPGATAADRQQLARLLTEVSQGNRSGAELAAITLQAERLVRQAGRAVPLDPRLEVALANASARGSALADQQKQLVNEAATGNKSQGELIMIQADADEVQQRRDTLDAIAREGKRLADDPNASAADRAAVTRLLEQAASPRTTAMELLRLRELAHFVGR